MAQGVLRHFVEAAGIGANFEIDSAGTHDYHKGEPPFRDAVRVAARRGYDLGHQVARPVTSRDFDHFEHILAMDKANISHLRTIAPTRSKQKIELLLEYGDKFHGEEVSDPYGGSVRRYERVLDMIEDGCKGLAQVLLRAA